MLKFKQFVAQILNEGGNAVEDARPISQSEIDATYSYVIKNVYPIVGLTEDYARPIGSFKKKSPDQTSGDIDIAVLADRIAGENGIDLSQVLEFMDSKLKAAGYSTALSKGFQQVSIGVPIEGDKKKGIAQTVNDNNDICNVSLKADIILKIEFI